ncbi:transposase [Pontibacter harenae]|uniref:transposase n=1 Tax=Pontibacter harenae TaxID=2894083 RepID=UPI003F6E7E2F
MNCTCRICWLTPAILTGATTPFWNSGRLPAGFQRLACISRSYKVFPYGEQADHFTCPAGKILPFKTYETRADGSALRIYRATYQDCKHCPLKPSCIPRSQCRQIAQTP